MLTDRRMLFAGVLSATAVAASVFAIVTMDAFSSSAEPKIEIGHRQREIVSDGVVTDAEYVESVDAMLGCLRESGFDSIEGPTWDATGEVLKFSFTYAPERMDEADKTYTKCEELHLGLVEQQRLLERLPDDAQLALARQSLVDCLVSNDIIEFDPDMLTSYESWSSEIRDTAREADFEVWTECITAASVSSGIPNFGG